MFAVPAPQPAKIVKLLKPQSPEIKTDFHAQIHLEACAENGLWFYSIRVRLKVFWLNVPVGITQKGEETQNECLTKALCEIEKRMSPGYYDDLDDQAICAALLEEVHRLGTKGQMFLF